MTSCRRPVRVPVSSNGHRMATSLAGAITAMRGIGLEAQHLGAEGQHVGPGHRHRLGHQAQQVTQHQALDVGQIGALGCRRAAARGGPCGRPAPRPAARGPGCPPAGWRPGRGRRPGSGCRRWWAGASSACTSANFSRVAAPEATRASSRRRPPSERAEQRGDAIVDRVQRGHLTADDAVLAGQVVGDDRGLRASAPSPGATRPSWMACIRASTSLASRGEDTVALTGR